MSDSEEEETTIKGERTIAERFVGAGMRSKVARVLEKELRRRRDEFDGDLWQLIEKVIHERYRALDWIQEHAKVQEEMKRLGDKHTNHNRHIYCWQIVIASDLGMKRKESLRLLNAFESDPKGFLYNSCVEFVIMRLQSAIFDIRRNW